MPVEVGEYRARALKAAGKLNEEGTNCAINIIFQVYEKSMGGGLYEPAEGTIYGSFWLLKNDPGNPEGGKVHNDFTIKALREAFAWDGVDPDWFADHINSQECRITTEWESYDGKNRLRVKWLNPAAGLKPPTDEERKSISTLFKTLVSSGAPSSAPTGAAKPARPVKPATARPTAAKAAAAADAIRGGQTAPPGRAPKKVDHADTRGALRACFPPGADDAALDAAWWKLADKLFPGYSDDQKMALSSDDCAKFVIKCAEIMAEKSARTKTTDDSATHFSADDIPF